MIKEVSLAVLTALNMNVQDATISDYNAVTKNINTEQAKSLIKKGNVNLTPQKKAEIQQLADETLELWSMFEETNKNILLNHFDKWIVENSEEVCDTIDIVMLESKVASTFFTKIAKQYKDYPSISRKVEEVVKISKDLYNFTLAYKERTNAARDTLSFLQEFIPANREALEALG